MLPSAHDALAEYCRASDPRRVVVFATDRCSPARGGVQTYVQQLVDCLSDRFRFVILSATRDTASLDEAVLRREPPLIERLGSGARVALVVCARLSATGAAAYRQRRGDEQRLNADHPESYHANRWRTMTILASLLADQLGVIRASHVTVHAMGPWEMSLTAERVFPNASRVVTPFIHPGHWGDDADSLRWLGSADQIIALTAADRAVCASVGLPTDRTTVVPVPYARRSSGPVSGGRDVVAFVGVNRPYKGADLFVAAAELIAPRWPNVDFVLLASPAQGAESAFERTKGKRVRWVISPSDRERDEFLSRAACVVLPSATEISPYAILEGWDHGAVAVVSDDAHFRSFVGGGGVCVPRCVESVAAAMGDVLTGTIASRRMAEVGRSRLEELHAPQWVAATMARLYTAGGAERAFAPRGRGLSDQAQ